MKRLYTGRYLRSANKCVILAVMLLRSAERYKDVMGTVLYPSWVTLKDFDLVTISQLNETVKNFELYCRTQGHSINIMTDGGIRIDNFFLIEDYFNCSLMVWCRNEGVHDLYLESLLKRTLPTINTDLVEYMLIRSSQKRKKYTFNILWVDSHVYGIPNVSELSSRFICCKCGGLFNTPYLLRRHYNSHHPAEKTFRSLSKYAGKPMVVREYTHELLNSMKNIIPSEILATYEVGSEKYVTWDCEAILNPTSDTTYQQHHEVSVISITHNLNVSPDDSTIQTEFFHCLDELENDPYTIVKMFLERIQQLSLIYKELRMNAITPLIRQLEILKADLILVRSRLPSISSKDHNPYDSCIGKLTVECSTLPIFAYNSKGYDIPLIKKFFFPILVELHGIQNIRIIKPSGKYIHVSTPSFEFKDVYSFCSPATSLDKFQKCYYRGMIPQSKKHFPYNHISSFQTLKEKEFPSIDAFYNNLNGSTISLDLYNKYRDMYMSDRNRFHNLGAYLLWYCAEDTKILFHSIPGLDEVLKTRMGISMLTRDFFTLPSIGMCLLRAIKGNALFFPPADLHRKITSQIAGGYVCLQMRHASSKYGSKIKNPDVPESQWEYVDTILGFDSNAMYLAELKKSFPVGPPHKRVKENNVLKSKKVTYSNEVFILTSALSISSQGMQIQSSSSPSGEFILRKTNSPIDIKITESTGAVTLINYHGSFFHGCQEKCHNYTGCNNSSCICHKYTDYSSKYSFIPSRFRIRQGGDIENEIQYKQPYEVTFKEKYDKTISIDNRHKTDALTMNQTYKVLWSCTLRKMILEGKHVLDLYIFLGLSISTVKIEFRNMTLLDLWGISYPYNAHKSSITELQLKKDVCDGNFFGIIQCDIRCPGYLKERFSQMPPFILHHKVTPELLDPIYMRPLAGTYMKKSKEILIGSYSAEQVIITSEYVKFLVDLDINFISNVTETWQWFHDCYFNPLCDSITELRIEGDLNIDLEPVSDAAKNCGNSLYGQLVQNKSKWTETSLTTVDDYVRGTMENISSIDELENNILEITRCRGSRQDDNPRIPAFFILQGAKLSNLKFHFFLRKYLPNGMGELCYQDTDSQYYAICKSSIFECVPDNLKLQFLREYKNWFPRSYCDNHEELWMKSMMEQREWDPELMRTNGETYSCCEHMRSRSRRDPGNFYEDNIEKS
jgi:hypothetical protein